MRTPLPNKRFIRLLACGAPLWLLALALPMAWIAGALFLAALLALALTDLLRRPQPDDIVFSRHLPSAVGLGDTFEVTLELSNHSLRPLTLTLREELPDNLEAAPYHGPIELPPQGRGRLTYTARAIKRGRAEFASPILRIGDTRGLLLHDLSIPHPDTLKIYPRFRGADDFRLLARIDQRHEEAKRPRLSPGAGTDFESLRFYIPGEDLRNIDWKATARRNVLISQNRQVEKGQQVAVMIDMGRLMAETINDNWSKLDHALDAAVMLSYVVEKRGDSFALAGFSNRIEAYLPPRKGSGLVSKTLEILYPLAPRQVESDYWQVTAEIMGMLRRRSLVVMLTDVLDATSARGLTQNLVRAARKHVILCVALTDPRLLQLAHSIPRNTAETYQKAAASDALRRRSTALEQMRGRGIHVLDTTPDHLSIQLVRRYLEIRKANLQ